MSSELRRALGRFDLTALGINQVIGSAVFLLPAQIALLLGNWSAIGFVLAGVASLLIAFCFAEAAARFNHTGGAYLYTRTAFGPLAGSQIGWMQWFTRVASQASVANGLALALAFYWPGAAQMPGKAVVISLITLAFGFLHMRGIRQSAVVINGFTIAKLAPITVFLIAGVPAIDWARLSPLPDLSRGDALSAGLLLFFAFGGFEVVPVLAGESRNPARDLPFALIVTMVAVAIVMSLVQIVTMTTLPDVGKSTTPMADSALVILGPWGAGLIAAGSVISMTGHNGGSSLSAPRMLFAMAESGDLTRFFARLHPVYKTPHLAIGFSTVVALGLALSGSFVMLATISTVARIVTYLGVAAATLALRRASRSPFEIPAGPVVPVLAIVVSLAALAGATQTQLLAGAFALGAGAVLYFLNRR